MKAFYFKGSNEYLKPIRAALLEMPGVKILKEVDLLDDRVDPPIYIGKNLLFLVLDEETETMLVLKYKDKLWNASA